MPVGIDLWTRAGPVRGDRVIFFDRPRPAPELALTDGSVAGEDREWRLGPAELFEEWTEGRASFKRWRAVMVDPESRLAVGAVFWLTQRGAP